MDLFTIALISFVVILIGISKSAFAGALGVFAVPVLMFKFNAVDAIALMLPLLIIADTMSLNSFWKKWDNRLLMTLIPGALLGIVVGNLTMNHINADYLRIIIASICILVAIKNLWFKHITLSFINNKAGAVVMSATSGLTSTLVHAGGPPLIIYFTSIGLARTQFVATATAFFAIMNLVKLAGAVSLGLLTWNTIWTAAAFFPLAFVGNYIGVKINQTLDKQRFLVVMNYLLLILGSWLLIK